ncbi:MAG: hypothetical protein WBX25_03115 [Rhodomicrobium sp.]
MAEAIGKSAKTLTALFAHPIPANLHWSDVLTLLQRFGSVEHRRNGDLHVDVAGHRLTLKHTNEKQIDKDQIVLLRHFLEGLDITPGHRNLIAPEPEAFDQPGLIIVLDHHEATLWQQAATNAPVEERNKLQPHDPHHFRHHLAHRKEASYTGQRAPEDYEFYKELVKALENAPQAIVIGDAAGKSSAMQFFRDYLAEHHKALLQRVSAFADADLSSLTEPQIREIAARYWH